MYSYANAVRSMLNQNNREIMMEFLQAAPKYKEDSIEVDGATVETVASIVMHPEEARGFANSILELLKNNGSTEK